MCIRDRRQGVTDHLAAVARLVPGADLLVQLDEPSLPAVLAGRLPTASGYGRLPAVTPEVATAALAALSAGQATVLHCCAADVPVALLRAAGPHALSLETELLGPRGWESVAVAVEAGIVLYAGVVPTSGDYDPARLASGLVAAWTRLGLAPRLLADVVVTPACGLAGSTPADAVARQLSCREIAERLGDASES